MTADTTTTTTLHLPATTLQLRPGERYAGAVLDQDGNVLHHIALLPDRPEGDVNWQAAKAWAASVGGELPSRQEQALLLANCKPHLPRRWCWASEEHAKDASYAWDCDFSHGLQDNFRKSWECSAVAVRRLNPSVL